MTKAAPEPPLPARVWFRAEPWILFLAVLGLLLLPGGRAYCWAAILAVLAARAVARWREAWRFFSLETIGAFVRTVLLLLGVILLIFFLQQRAPGWLH